PELAAQLDGFRGLLGELDRFAQKSMRIHLTHSPDALPQQLRTLVQSTILSYEGDLPVLRARVAAAMARLDRAAATGVADRVIEAADQVLSTRARLRQAVLELAQSVATGWLPGAQ